jgi:PhnB protein
VTGGLCLYVPDVDASFDRAVAAGATVKMPVADMFWGDRYGKVIDPFGHEWSLGTHKEDLTPEEMMRRGEEAMAQMCQPQEVGATA